MNELQEDLTIPEGSVAQPAVDPLDEDVLEVDTETADGGGQEAGELQSVRDDLGITELVDPLQALLDAPLGPVLGAWSCPRLNTEFTIRALDSTEFNQIQERSTRFTRNKRTGRMDRDIDATTMSLVTIAAACVNPDFRSSELAKRYPNRQSHEIVSASLLPGEVDSLANKIMVLSGFNDDLEDAGKD